MQFARTFGALALAVITLSIGCAEAAWVPISDPDSFDAATNPGYPTNQSPNAVGTYVQDLLDLGSVPSLIAANDHYSGSALTGLGNPAPGEMFVLAFHFGNGNDSWPHRGPFDVFFECESACDSFVLPFSSTGVGSFRLYDPPIGPSAPAIPEPGSLLLLGVGLLGLAASRCRKLI